MVNAQNLLLPLFSPNILFKLKSNYNRELSVLFAAMTIDKGISWTPIVCGSSALSSPATEGEERDNMSSVLLLHSTDNDTLTISKGAL